jgi:ferrous iron transport protein A
MMESMTNTNGPLTNLPYNREARIIKFTGGHRLHHKLRVMGIREGRIIKIISKQPLQGPLTIAVNGNQVTLGRGMSEKIIVEKI